MNYLEKKSLVTFAHKPPAASALERGWPSRGIFDRLRTEVNGTLWQYMVSREQRMAYANCAARTLAGVYAGARTRQVAMHGDEALSLGVLPLEPHIIRVARVVDEIVQCAVSDVVDGSLALMRVLEEGAYINDINEPIIEATI